MSAHLCAARRQSAAGDGEALVRQLAAGGHVVEIAGDRHPAVAARLRYSPTPAPRRRHCASWDRRDCRLPRPNSRAGRTGPIGVNMPVERRSEAITSATWRPTMSPGITGTAMATLVLTLPPTSSGNGSSCGASWATAAPARPANNSGEDQTHGSVYPVDEGDSRSSRRSACRTARRAGEAACIRRRCGAPGPPAGRHIWRGDPGRPTCASTVGGRIRRPLRASFRLMVSRTWLAPVADDTAGDRRRAGPGEGSHWPTLARAWALKVGAAGLGGALLCATWSSPMPFRKSSPIRDTRGAGLAGGTRLRRRRLGDRRWRGPRRRAG